MSDWPPNPNPGSNSSSNQNQPSSAQSGQTDALQVLEKAILATVNEQRQTRRWNIFFRFVSAGLMLLFLLVLMRGCSVGSSSANIGSASPHLAVINIDGEIGSGATKVNSNDVIDSLDRAFDASNSKAIALNINSPGGSPVQSDMIWQEVKRLQALHKDKKVYAVIGDMGASGAYYIASAADEIYVNPSSLVGSIGVIMSNYGVTELAHKVGVEDRTLTAGAHKAILSPTLPVNPVEKAHVQAVLDNVHQHFIDAVKTGRGNRLKVDTPDLFSGYFWSGDQAIQIGLADKVGGVDTLKRQLKLDSVVDYTAPQNPLQGLIGGVGTKLGLGFAEALKQQLGVQSKVTLQ